MFLKSSSSLHLLKNLLHEFFIVLAHSSSLLSFFIFGISCVSISLISITECTIGNTVSNSYGEYNTLFAYKKTIILLAIARSLSSGFHEIPNTVMSVCPIKYCNVVGFIPRSAIRVQKVWQRT